MSAKDGRAGSLRHSLTEIDLLQGIPPDDLKRLAQRCTWRRFGPSQQIITQNDDSRDLFHVVSGRVRVTVFSPSGKEVNFRELSAGESFGELSAIDGQPRSATVVSLSETLIAAMPSEMFIEVLREHPDVAIQTMRRLTRLVRLLSERVYQFSTLAVRNRIRWEIVRLAREHIARGGKAEIHPAPTHADIASRVSTHREAVTRELSAMTRERLIERRSGRLVIHDLDRLVQNVEAMSSTSALEPPPDEED